MSLYKIENEKKLLLLKHGQCKIMCIMKSLTKAIIQMLVQSAEILSFGMADIVGIVVLKYKKIFLKRGLNYANERRT